MANYFDRYDAAAVAPTQQGNYFDKYDEPKVGTGEDIAKSGAIGVVKGGIGLAGMGGDIGNLVAAGAEKLGLPEDLRRGFGAYARTNPLLSPFTGPGSQDTQKAIESYTGQFYKPKTTAGEYAQTVGEFAPAALAGPGKLGQRLFMQAVAPALTSETAGQIARQVAPEYEGAARFGTALATPAGLSTARRATTPIQTLPERQAARDYLRSEGVTDLTAGQITGSQPQQYREATAGWKFDAKRQRQLEQLTEASLRPIGETGTNVHEAVQRA